MNRLGYVAIIGRGHMADEQAAFAVRVEIKEMSQASAAVEAMCQ